MNVSSQQPAGGAAEAIVDSIGFVQKDAAAVLSLHRPEALNALNVSMRRRIAGMIPAIARDVMTYILIWKSASDRAFSAGGDLRELGAWATTEPERARQSFKEEYELNWLLECFSKPSVALVNGMTIGGGAGLIMYSTHRVAGANYSFSMPETAIGFFPDDGLVHVFAKMPASIGMYLGLTGRSIGPADAFYLDLITHFIEAADFQAIEDRLADVQPVDPLLDGLHRDPGPSELERLAPLIDRTFSAPSVEEIIARLEREDEEREWCDSTVTDLLARSPLALKVTHRHIRDASRRDLRQTLQVDYRLACRLLDHPDFAEGIRARILDKDNRPQWQPDRLADVTVEMVDTCFAYRPGGELLLPTRQQMQAMRDKAL